MLARHMLLSHVRLSARLSVRLSQAGIILKWLNIRSRKQRRTKAQELYSFLSLKI